jgi:hypothetical protein
MVKCTNRPIRKMDINLTFTAATFVYQYMIRGVKTRSRISLNLNPLGI